MNGWMDKVWVYVQIIALCFYLHFTQHVHFSQNWGCRFNQLLEFGPQLGLSLRRQPAAPLSSSASEARR